MSDYNYTDMICRKDLGVMEYMSCPEAAKKWGISERRVQVLCRENRIPGVSKLGYMWLIPKDAEKPIDGRTKRGKERENMADQTIPDYETISAAVTGETWAVEKVLMCYKDEIDRQATVKKRQPDGTFKLEIDEDMRQYITMKLIEALPQFPLEEMEREEKRNRDKKS